MAVNYGVVTFTPTNDDWREFLAAAYAWFLAGHDPIWSIDNTVTRPTQIATAGDTGFCLVNAGGVQLLIADHAAVGGLCMDGGALGVSDLVVVAIVPGGGTTDMRSGSWAVGASFSGWVVEANGVTRASHAGRAMISSDTNWLFVRFRTTVTNAYSGGFFLGGMTRFDSGLGSGWVAAGGLWSDFSTAATSANDHMGYQSYTGSWMPCRLQPADTAGLIGNNATDGAGTFRKAPVTVSAVPGDGSSPATSYVPVGGLPALFCSANGTIGSRWRDGATVTGFNMSGGCYVALSDGSVAE